MLQSQGPPPARPSKRPRRGQPELETPQLPEDLVVEQILTRVPAAATVRLRAVYRAWRAALTSDHFVRAHRAARAAAGQAPEVVFFAPAAAAAGSTATTFYSYKLTQQKGSPSEQAAAAAAAAARELVTVEKLRAHDVVLCGTRPCRGLTLLFQRSACAYHVCNLATGEHVALPPCAPANEFSSAGLGYDAAAGEHKVVRLFEDNETKQQRCEVFGLRSGGWRRCAGQPPPHVARGLDGSAPVFLDGRFYWHVDIERIFADREVVAMFLSTAPERILTLAAGTGQFGSVPPPEERAESVSGLVELGGSLCAVVDARLTAELYELWTLSSSPPSSPSWRLRCRISLATLPAPVRDDMGRGIRMLPLGGAAGKILLASSRHMVYAYDPESGGADRVFSMQEFVDAPRELHLLNVPCTRKASPSSAAGDGQLKVKLGGDTIARRGGPAAQYREDTCFTPQFVQSMLAIAMAQYQNFVNMQN
ncbi:hypothetical protein ACP4OV_009288 [Aristida adscensionis]